VKCYSIKISGFEHKGTKNTQRTQRVDFGLLSKDFTFKIECFSGLDPESPSLIERGGSLPAGRQAARRMEKQFLKKKETPARGPERQFLKKREAPARGPERHIH